jgi:hypothetical protein
MRFESGNRGRGTAISATDGQAAARPGSIQHQRNVNPSENRKNGKRRGRGADVRRGADRAVVIFRESGVRVHGLDHHKESDDQHSGNRSQLAKACSFALAYRIQDNLLLYQPGYPHCRMGCSIRPPGFFGTTGRAAILTGFSRAGLTLFPGSLPVRATHRPRGRPTHTRSAAR